jgi:hypothetical protein
MLPRGEVTLAVAAGLATTAGSSSAELYATLVTVVFASALLAAPLVQAALPREERHPARPRREIPPEAFDADDEP